MKREQLEKIRTVRCKEIFCPVCKRWEKVNAGDVILHDCNESDCLKFIFLFDDKSPYSYRSEEMYLIGGPMVWLSSDFRRFTSGMLELDKDCVHINMFISKCNPYCDRYSWCYERKDIEKDIEIILKFDEEELKKVGLLPEESRDEEEIDENSNDTDK